MVHLAFCNFDLVGRDRLIPGGGGLALLASAASVRCPYRSQGSAGTRKAFPRAYRRFCWSVLGLFGFALCVCAL